MVDPGPKILSSFQKLIEPARRDSPPERSSGMRNQVIGKSTSIATLPSYLETSLDSQGELHQGNSLRIALILVSSMRNSSKVFVCTGSKK